MKQKGYARNLTSVGSLDNEGTLVENRAYAN